MFTPSGGRWTPPGGRWYRLKYDGTTRSSPGGKTTTNDIIFNIIKVNLIEADHYLIFILIRFSKYYNLINNLIVTLFVCNFRNLMLVLGQLWSGFKNNYFE